VNEAPVVSQHPEQTTTNEATKAIRSDRPSVPGLGVAVAVAGACFQRNLHSLALGVQTVPLVTQLTIATQSAAGDSGGWVKSESR
jgi:hypothetical protein